VGSCSVDGPTSSSQVYWPHAKLEEAAIAGPMNKLPKYVASTTLTPVLFRLMLDTAGIK
jgi:hypothetical protein